MKCGYLILLFLLAFGTFIMSPGLVIAQKLYEGQVLDNTTESPLPGTTVTLLKQKISVKSNDQGYFKLAADAAIQDDIIVFTFIGYKTYSVPVKNYKDYLYISLEPTDISLNQVNISAGKSKQITLDRFSIRDIPEERVTSQGIMIISSKFSAKSFEVPVENAKLLKVQLGRRYFSRYVIKLNTSARFILHIMDADNDTGAPAKTLFSKEVVLDDNSHLISVDFSKDSVILPSRFFIAVERLFIPYNEVISMASTEKSGGLSKRGKQIIESAPLYFVAYQPFLVPRKLQKNASHWNTNKEGAWVPRKNGYTLALSATILY